MQFSKTVSINDLNYQNFAVRQNHRYGRMNVAQNASDSRLCNYGYFLKNFAFCSFLASGSRSTKTGFIV